MADTDAYVFFDGNLGIADPAPESRGAYVDFEGNLGVAIGTDLEFDRLSADLFFNVGVELPPSVQFERPQLGWGVPCVPTVDVTIFPVDTNARASMEVEVT